MQIYQTKILAKNTKKLRRSTSSVRKPRFYLPQIVFDKLQNGIVKSGIDVPMALALNNGNIS